MQCLNLPTLERVLDWRPEHLSCYQLTFEPGTEMDRRRAAGDFRTLGEEKERDFFLFTSQFLYDQGYLHYEVSNFARGEAHCSRHNCNYWGHAPYLGLGPAAHSFQNGRRWWNSRSVAEYAEKLGNGEAPLAGEEALTADQVRLEALLLGFRTRAGVELSLIRELPAGQENLDRLAAAGLLTVQNGRAVPTREGLALADRLPLWFG